MEEEYCWAITTGGGAVTLRPINFQRARVWFPTGLPCVHKCVVDHMRTQHRPRKIRLAPDLPVRKYCVSGSSVRSSTVVRSVRIQVRGCSRKTLCLRKAWMLLVFV